MKTVPGLLATHVDGETTNLATLWRVTRVSGEKHHFTDHDRDIEIDVDVTGGTNKFVYKSSSGYSRTTIQNTSTLSVDNLDVRSHLDPQFAQISEADVQSGKMDFAQIEVFEVNYLRPQDGVAKLRKGFLGEINLEDQAYQAELRGLVQLLSQTIGEKYTAQCRADLGDDRCTVPTLPKIVERGTTYAVGDFVRATPLLESFLNPTLLVSAEVDLNDESSNLAIATVGSQAARVTAPTIIGAGLIEFTPSGSQNPSNSFVSFPDIAAYTIGTQPFTIEGFVRIKDLTQSFQVFASQLTNTGNQRAWRIGRNGANLEFGFGTSGATLSTVITRPVTWVIDTTYHFAATRDASDDVRLFLDGVQLGATVNDASNIFNSTSPLFLGKYRSAGATDDPLDGFLDQFRFIVGVAAYTTGFSPPTGQFSTRAGILAGADAFDFEDRIYECTTAGTTTLAVQPTYDSVVGNTTTDGTAVFTARNSWARAFQILTVIDNRSFVVTELTPNSGQAVSDRVPTTIGFPNDWFTGGLVHFDTGNNADLTQEVDTFAADDGVTIEQTVGLFVPMPFVIQVGDIGFIIPGCDKSVDGANGCKIKFDNVLNFRGEPYIPGNDQLTRGPDVD